MKLTKVLQSKEVAYKEEKKVLKYIDKKKSGCRIISVNIFRCIPR